MSTSKYINAIPIHIHVSYGHTTVKNYPTFKRFWMYLLNLMNLDDFSWTQCLKRHDFSWFQRKCNLCNFGMIFITSIFHVHGIMISINTLLDHWLMLWAGWFSFLYFDGIPIITILKLFGLMENKEPWIDHVSVENVSTRKHFFLDSPST